MYYKIKIIKKSSITFNHYNIVNPSPVTAGNKNDNFIF